MRRMRFSAMPGLFDCTWDHAMRGGGNELAGEGHINDLSHDVVRYGDQRRGSACGSPACRPNVGVGEIISSEQQRLCGDMGQGVAICISEVEPGPMPAAAAVVSICLRGYAGLVGIKGFDLVSMGVQQATHQSADLGPVPP